MLKYFQLTLIISLSTFFNGFSQNEFDLFREVYSPQKNTLISNFSINSALGMLDLCVDEGAQTEINQQLGVKKAEEYVKFNSMLRNKITFNSTFYSVHNALWLDKSYTVKSNTKKELQTYFDLYIKSMSFSNANLVKNNINNYVNEKTEGKIKEIVSSIEKDDRMLLINTILMKTPWKKQFQEKDTKKGDFNLPSGEIKELDYLFDLNRKIKCYSTDSLKVASLEFDDNKTELLLIMPTKESIDSFMSSDISKKKVKEYQKLMTEEEVYFKMPKVKMSFSNDLIPALKKCGIERVFLPGQSDFSALIKNETDYLFVSKVMHKTVLEFNEWGTEAAAVTSVAVSRSAIQPEKQEYYFNRPFIFIIREKATDAYLFMGTFLGK
ncbi:hypothetical protein KMW28_12070 [Flammeovirga yaeyamensis]|uniref:Serpin domain-containing protein n=1 Tax=Flammeovirga yaeyamensis TaxID=367791 RepID=A0AAX1MYH8_9BACT|nr:serpin family protein [Flammeovirga yaeyamensis]MBB3696098.1 serine protease inhibitor [Flammeovirga yaeyamensis]NMF34783.1 serpin family protein [Flammeovirga yaeyamensis]QWG00389.1 hypothetical protein KMW28_12070 [Flammeovirga yaeyamensis]